MGRLKVRSTDKKKVLQIKKKKVGSLGALIKKSINRSKVILTD